ncbi:MAG: hypothetical protein IJT91_07525 [Clostridia bacterium]|nr:hypothetical protein [Clostridia bacterium]
MKKARIISAVLALLILLPTAAACGKKSNGSAPAREISTELIDSKNPVTDADSGSYSRTGDDGIEYKGSYRYPKIVHKTLTGAEEINKEIEQYFKENYSALFASDSDEKLFVTVDYKTVYEYDILSIIITAEKKTEADGTPVCDYKAFFYDALTDAGISRDDYLSYIGHSTAEVYNAAGQAYPDAVLNENDFNFAQKVSSYENEELAEIDIFDVYFNGDHGDKIYNVEVKKVTPDLSADTDDMITLN